MASYPQSLMRLIQYFSKLPGVGRRGAERAALAVYRWPEADAAGFAEAIGTIQRRMHACAICGNYSDEEICGICSDAQRDKSVICVVEQPSQILVFENAGCYRGHYHVLGGTLSPLSGRGPEQLRIRELHQRVETGDVRELILATTPDVEGEATAHYLAREFASPNLKITRIAAGVPIGSDLNYADAATLSIAMQARRAMENA